METSISLTKVELELMTILWRLKQATVRDVLNELPAERPLAYTSASTMIRILEKKGVVSSQKQGKTHVYTPVLSKTDYEASSLNQIIHRVFEGTPSELVKRLVSEDVISAEEKAAIKKILEEL